MTEEKQRICLLKSGDDFFNSLSQLIDCAQQHIYLNFYIFSDDETGNKILSLLSDAAMKGVKVFLITDGVGTNISKEFRHKINRTGISHLRFGPLFNKQTHWARRMHEKLALIDQQYLLIGGMNVSDKYNSTKNGKPWLDFAVLIKGKIALDAYLHCLELWKSSSRHATTAFKMRTCTEIDLKLTRKVRAKLLINDWLLHKNEITSKYIQLIRTAHSGITILCSYFIPGSAIRRLLANASKRGVAIRIITTGISDVYLAKSAEKWLYDWLLRNEIEIYEYQKNVLHGKLAIADKQYMTIGSYNINDISAYTSMEMNVEISDPIFCMESENQLEDIIQNDCIQITRSFHLNHKNWLIQLIRWLSYQFIRITIAIIKLKYRRKAIGKKYD